MNKKRIIVALSGGVDSSVAAYLLKQEGHEVIGLYMKNWEEKEDNGVCTSLKDQEDVARVCDQLKIPHYTVNFVDEYWNSVFSKCLEDFKLGYTPNPDILCNREIKFNALLERAVSMGGDILATGHYCQIGEGATLLKGADPSKDQSYFLYTLKNSILEKVRFPIGHLPKTKVRAIAREASLSTSDKKDSTGICFIGERKFLPFLNQFIDKNPGNFVDPEGNIIGTHVGLPFYTIGQRKGIGIGGKGAAWFVVGKNIEKNEVIVAQGDNHPALYKTTLIANELTWVQSPPLKLPFSCTCKIRYRQEDAPCTIESIENGVATVQFQTPQRAITPRQSIVFYQENICLGGGLIC